MSQLQSKRLLQSGGCSPSKARWEVDFSIVLEAENVFFFFLIFSCHKSKIVNPGHLSRDLSRDLVKFYLPCCSAFSMLQ